MGAQSVQGIGSCGALLVASQERSAAAASACRVAANCACWVISQPPTGIVTSVAIAHCGVLFPTPFPFPVTIPVPFRFRPPASSRRLFWTAATFLFFCLIGFAFVVAVVFIRWGRRTVTSFIFVVVVWVNLGYDPRCTKRAQNKTKVMLLFSILVYLVFFQCILGIFAFSSRRERALPRHRPDNNWEEYSDRNSCDDEERIGKYVGWKCRLPLPKILRNRFYFCEKCENIAHLPSSCARQRERCRQRKSGRARETKRERTNEWVVG